MTASLFDSKVLVVAYTIPLCSPLAHTAHTSRRRVGCQLAAAPCDGRASSCWPSVSAQTHLNVLVSTAGIKVGRAGTCGALTLDLQDGVRGSGITGPSRPSPSGVTVSCDARGRGAAREDASIRDNEKKFKHGGRVGIPTSKNATRVARGRRSDDEHQHVHSSMGGMAFERSYIITLLILCLQRFRRPRKRRRPRRRRTRAARPTQLGSAGRGRCTSPRDTDRDRSALFGHAFRG